MFPLDGTLCTHDKGGSIKVPESVEAIEGWEWGLEICFAGASRGRMGFGLPGGIDWMHVKYFIQFLKLFYEITVCMFSCIANIFFENLLGLFDHLQQSYDEV